MTHTRTKLLIGALAIVGSVVFLAVAGVREGWVYYLPVDQFVETTSYQDKRVRLHGTVGEENLQANAALLSAQFVLHGEAREIRVDYRGVIPDLFQAGNDVVVEGKLGEDGVFQADTLMTKCASKYEAEGGEAPHADPYQTNEEAG